MAIKQWIASHGLFLFVSRLVGGQKWWQSSRRNITGQASQKLTAFTKEFAGQNAQTEPKFVGLGNALRDLHLAATELTELVRNRAGNFRSALEECRIAGPDGLAAKSLAEVGRTSDETSQLLHSLDDVRNALQRLQSQVEGFQRISMFLKASVFGFAVESVRTPECQEAFTTFVVELKALTARIGDLGENIREEVKATQAAQTRGFNSLSSSWLEMGRVGEDLKQKCEVTAAEAQKLLDASADALQEAEQCVQQIARHAGEAVYHLQLGDIVRQKAEHIVASLEEAAGQLAKEEDPALQCATADHVLAVQISQIDLIRQEILEAHAKLVDSFQGLEAQTQHLVGSLERQFRESHGSGSAVDSLQALLADTLQIERLQHHGAELGRRARSNGQAAIEASTRLARHLDHVKTINQDMHFQALNAIVKTAALGKQGTTLEVLSMEVDHLFQDSNQVVGNIVAMLEQILSQARNAAVENSAASELSAADSREKGSRLGLERIAEAYKQFNQTASEARSLVEKQRASLAASETELNFLPSLAETLAQQSENLSSLRHLLGASSDARSQAPAAQTVESLGQRYTMQSERDIHERILGKTPEQPAAPSPAAPISEETVAAAVKPSETDLGDNMELF